MNSQSDSPVATALIPALQHDDWLDLAVDSVLSGDDASRVLVIFDGGNARRGVPWLESPRVDFIELAARGGLASALNIGLREASTEYIARLDADDIAMPGRLPRQRDFLEANPRMLLTSGSAVTIDSEGRRVGGLSTPSGRDSLDVRRNLLVRNCLIHPAVMLRRTVALDAGGYDVSLPYMEDYEFWLRLGLMGPLGMTATEEVGYRLHPNQMTKAAPPRGRHIDAVTVGRANLARALGEGKIRQSVRDQAWSLSQRARYTRASLAKRLANR